MRWCIICEVDISHLYPQAKMCSNACRRARSQEKNRNWCRKNLEKARENRRNWRRKNLEKERENRRNWRRKNLEKERERDRNRRRKNPEKARENYHNWYRKNLEKVRERDRNRDRKQRLVANILAELGLVTTQQKKHKRCLSKIARELNLI